MNTKKEISEKKCENCQKVFTIKLIKREINKRFCSSFCASSHNGKLNLGKKRSDEFKNKIKEKSMGEKNNFFGKKHSKESKKRMANSRLKISIKKGKRCTLSNAELEILDGILLADASLDGKSTISSRITYGCKFKETLEHVINSFQSISFGKIFEYKSKPHKKNGKQYTDFFLKSYSYIDLLKQRNRWYKSKKRIPDDVLITPTSCYWWFLGDGYVNCANVILCTECFDVIDKNILIKKLKKLKFNVNINSKGRLFFDKKSSYLFLKWIFKKNKIPTQYEYKIQNYNLQNKNEKYKIKL